LFWVVKKKKKKRRMATVGRLTRGWWKDMGKKTKKGLQKIRGS